jgi:UDP-MurNAc hydroxylase
MQVTTLGHAAAFYRLDSGATLLLDPWLTDPAYFHSWWHFPPLRLRVRDLGRIDGVYLSHDHPDHCDPKTLAQLPRDTEFLIANFAGDAVDRILKALGFRNVRRMKFREPFEWRGARVECLRTDLPWDDSSLLVTDGGATVFDMNDCKFNDASLDALGARAKIDLALLPYSGAIQFPTCYEMPAQAKLDLCEKRRADHARLFADRASRLRPRFAVPFAAGYCLPSPEQWWMNDINNIISPARARDELVKAAPRAHDGSAVEALEMNPGDCWDSKTGRVERAAPPPDWSKHFELVREYARSIGDEVARARAAEADPEPGLDRRFLESFRKLVLDQAELAKAASYRVQFDARGAQGFLGFVDTTGDAPKVGLGRVEKPNLVIRIPTPMLDAVLAGKVVWDEILISFRLWFDEQPPVYNEAWWALLHSSNRLDPERYLSKFAEASGQRS